MTRWQAYKEAHSRWGTADRHGFVVSRQKKIADRFEVGYHSAHGAARPVIMGRGPSWEAAFAQADLPPESRGS